MSELNESGRRDYLAKYGKALIENGYSIIPIPVGSKSPGYDGWQRTQATYGKLKDWLNNGHKNSGVGILTKTTPAIDLDILDEAVCTKIQEWCELYLGAAPVRVGRAPRRLLACRTDEPFRKMKSGKYKDEWGDEHEIEILCDGQQYVAYAVHKDTGKPYEWISESHPAVTPYNELPLLTPEMAQELLAYFDQVCIAEGWEKVSGGLSGGARPADAEHDVFADVESVVDLPAEEIRKRLMLVPGADEYELWTQIGMALYHQFDGDETGLGLWHEWSETADNYDAEALEAKWTSFNIAGKRRAPITGRLILKLASEAMSTMAAAVVADLREEFYKAKDVADWKAVCVKVKKAEIDQIARAEIAEIARKRYQDISGSKLPITEIRKALAFELTSHSKTPQWCKDWVYDSAEDRFFHLITKISMTQQGFNNIFGRQALTKKDILEGRSSPSSTASDLALNVFQIKEVHGRMYSPGDETTFYENGLRVANTYPDYQVPKTPETLSPKDKRAIKRVKAHIAHLFPDVEHQALVLNILAFWVQNPGKRLNWAVVFQGVEGDGKTFFAMLASRVMGPSNVRMMNAHVLEGGFTGWGHGQCLTVIEEPRLQGHNKYDVLNKIKPLITNTVIEIHPKGKDPYNVINTVNYFLCTNYRDALPLGLNDRRYLVLFTQWQSHLALKQFKDANPDYYVELYRTLEECGPALRKWLIDHEIDDAFPAGSDAPRTMFHQYMVDASQPETLRAINELIAEGTVPDITAELVNITSLPDALIGRDTEILNTSSLTKMMENAGYVYLGRVKIDGTPSRYWSRSPEKFRDGQNLATYKIRKYIENRKKLGRIDEL